MNCDRFAQESENQLLCCLVMAFIQRIGWMPWQGDYDNKPEDENIVEGAIKRRLRDRKL